MKALVMQYLDSVSIGKPAQARFYCGDRRKQKNIERIAACQSMTYAAMRGVIADHRVVEALVKVDDMVRSNILRLEAKLGRKLSRERAQALLAAYSRIRKARNRKMDLHVLPGLMNVSLATTAMQHTYH
jgi:hypothetical protein